MNPCLPPELLDNIFLHLRLSRHIGSLRACAKAHPLFRQLAEPHLYYHVHFGFTEEKRSQSLASSPSDLHKLLLARPHIAAYIRSVTIRLTHSIGDIFSRGTSSLDFHTNLTRVLLLLTNLERFVLDGRSSWLMLFDAYSWSRVNHNLQSACASVLKLPSVEEVTICELIDFPLGIISNSAALKKLCLLGRFAYEPKRLPTLVEGRGHLKSLTLHSNNHSSWGTILQFITWSYSGAGPDVSQLTHLKVTAPNLTSFESLPFILSLCSGSLRSLEIDPGGLWNSVFRSGTPDIVDPTSDHFLLTMDIECPPTTMFSTSPSPLTVKIPTPDTATSSSGSPESDALSISLTKSFDLRDLSSLKHLRLALRIESSRSSPFGEYYLASFHWLSRFLESLQGSRRCSSSAPQATIPTEVVDTRNTNRVALECLTLNIVIRSTSVLDRVSWRALSDPLLRFSSVMPSLELVELVIRVDDSYVKHPHKEAGKIVRNLKNNIDLAPLVREGLVWVRRSSRTA